jgi:pullulanase/glycogen debranching enzyme
MNRSKPSDPNLDANNGNADSGFFHNSYNAPDRVNSLKWDLLYDQPTVDVLEYYQGMIAFRKAHPALRLTTANDVNERVSFLPNLPTNVLGYMIKAEGVEGETAKNIICLYNATANAAEIELPEGEWTVCANKTKAGIYNLGTVSGKVSVDSVSALILVQGEVAEAPDAETPDVETPDTQKPDAAEPIVKTTTKVTTNWILVIGIWAAVAVVGVVGVVLLLKKK